MTKHEGQWTLGQLIDAMEKAKPTSIYHAYGGLHVDDVRSYRGYYEDLAIGMTAAWSDGCYDGVEFLEYLKTKVLGNTFEGYKGGDYVATRETPLWIASYGDCSDTIVTGLHVTGETALIVGKWVGHE